MTTDTTTIRVYRADAAKLNDLRRRYSAAHDKDISVADMFALVLQAHERNAAQPAPEQESQP